MRTFISIELSDSIKDSLAQAQSHLKYAGADVKWIEKGNIHLTLKFLGEIDEKKCEEVKITLDKIAGETRPFEISIKDIGAFPKIEFPRVIWVGLDKGAAESKILAEKIDDALSKIGFQKESRPFTAHLTIGRVRSSKNKSALQDKLQTTSLAPGPLSLVLAVILFQSTLTPNGSIYTKLHEAKFSHP